MARRPSAPPPPEVVQLTPAALRSGVDRLRKRIEEVKQFDPTTVIEQFDIPNVEKLSAAVEESLVRTFGHGTVDYNRYAEAAQFDNGPFNYAYEVSIQRVHESLARSKARSIALLESAVKSLEELIEESEPTVTALEVVQSRFSRRTLIASVEVLEHVLQNTASATRCFLKWGSEVAKRCDPGSPKDRFNHLIRYVDEEPNKRTADGELLREAIVIEAVDSLPSFEYGLLRGNAEPKTALLRALDSDGFIVTDGALRRTLPPELQLPQAERSNHPPA